MTCRDAARAGDRRAAGVPRRRLAAVRLREPARRARPRSDDGAGLRPVGRNGRERDTGMSAGADVRNGGNSVNIDYVRALTFAPIAQAYDARDSALYALSLGMGSDPTDEDELPYVYEGRGPLAAPSQCVTLCWPPFWHREPATGIAWRRILHGEQRFVLHRPILAEGLVEAEHRVIALADKGAGRGAVLYTGHDIKDQTTGAPLADMTAAEFLRDDGGAGGFGAPPPLPIPATRSALSYSTTAASAFARGRSSATSWCWIAARSGSRDVRPRRWRRSPRRRRSSRAGFPSSGVRPGRSPASPPPRSFREFPSR